MPWRRRWKGGLPRANPNTSATALMTKILFSLRIVLWFLKAISEKSSWMRHTIPSYPFILEVQRCNMTSSSHIGGLEWSEKLLNSWMNVMSAEGWKQNTKDQLVSSNLLLFQNASLIISRWNLWLDFLSPSVEMMLSSLSLTSLQKWLISFLSKNLSQQLSWQS